MPEALLQEVLHYIVDRLPHAVESEYRAVKDKINAIFENSDVPEPGPEPTPEPAPEPTQ